MGNNKAIMRPPLTEGLSPLEIMLYASVTLPTISYLLGLYKNKKKYDKYSKRVDKILADLKKNRYLGLGLDKSSMEKDAAKFTFWDYVTALPHALRRGYIAKPIQYTVGVPLSVITLLLMGEFYRNKLKKYSKKRREEIEKKLYQIPEVMMKSSGEKNANWWQDFVFGVHSTVQPMANILRGLFGGAANIYGLSLGIRFTLPIIASYLAWKWLSTREEKAKKKKELLLRSLDRGTLGKLKIRGLEQTFLGG